MRHEIIAPLEVEGLSLGILLYVHCWLSTETQNKAKTVDKDDTSNANLTPVAGNMSKLDDIELFIY